MLKRMLGRLRPAHGITQRSVPNRFRLTEKRKAKIEARINGAKQVPVLNDGYISPFERFLNISPEALAQAQAELDDPNFVPPVVEWLDDGPDPFGMKWNWAEPPQA